MGNFSEKSYGNSMSESGNDRSKRYTLTNSCLSIFTKYLAEANKFPTLWTVCAANAL